MPHDVMHVILEGVLPLHCKRLLVHCIYEERYFTLKLINRLILEFEYGYSEGRNVPRQLDGDHLRSSESKMSQSGVYHVGRQNFACRQELNPLDQVLQKKNNQR